ncbi:FAD:protein FMN transferase [Zhongshania marina]
MLNQTISSSMTSVGKFIQHNIKAALVLLLLFLSGCSPAPQEFLRLSGMTMGTTYHITVRNPAGEWTEQSLKEALDKRLAAFNQIASTYISNSELSQLNTMPAGEWRQLTPMLFDILVMAVEVSWLSNGAFDVTVGPLVDLWGFGPEKHEGKPSEEALNKALEEVGFDRIELDMADHKIKKGAPLRIDLSAIAKGYGVDAVALWLESLGSTDYLVEIGGEMRVAGLSPRGDQWRIGVESPDLEVDKTTPILLGNIGVATSGDYRNYFEENGVRYSHTIDPRTGRPITHNLASVTVLDPSCAFADAMATAFSVLGGDKTIELAEQLDIPVYLIEKTESGFSSRYSSSFAPYLEQEK